MLFLAEGLVQIPEHTSESPATRDLPAMCCAHDEDDEDIVEDIVDDAVVTDASATQAARSSPSGHFP